MRKVVILSFLTSLLLGACGEDDYVYPNVLTDMIDLKTDHTGTGRYLITDEGTEWRIQSRTGLDGLAPDTTYRTGYHVRSIDRLGRSRKRSHALQYPTGYFSCSLVRI